MLADAIVRLLSGPSLQIRVELAQKRTPLKSSFISSGLNHAYSGSQFDSVGSARGGIRSLRRPVATQAASGLRIKDMGARMKDMRASMDESEDERLKALMSGLRGQNIDDSDFAGSNVRMNLVEIVRGDDDDEELPLTYDPEAIAAYWDRRPVSIVTRVLQLMSEL